MRLTRKELEATGQALGFVLAGETDAWTDEDVKALEGAWTKIGKAISQWERKMSQQPDQRRKRC